MHESKIRKIGNSVGFTLPKQLVTQMCLTQGDKIRMFVAANGDLVLRPSGEDAQENARVTRDSIAQFRKAIITLSKT